MTILPIVERELRVAARRRGTYWTRLVDALTAIVVGFVVMFYNLEKPQATLSVCIFIGLAVLAMLHGLLAGRLSTADCLSEEKREGTLGLLFLTDLKGYDVVLGKLAATSVNSFYGLLAMMPVMAIPLLLGGVTNGQFWRMVLVLVNTFLFSLAVGMYCSAVSRDARQAMGLNLGLMFFFTALLPGCALLIAVNSSPRVFYEPFCYASPLYAFSLCIIQLVGIVGFPSASTPPPGFWESLLAIHLLTWLFLFLAARIAPRSWQDRPEPAARAGRISARERWRAWSFGSSAKLRAFRRRLLDENAFYWLASRARLKPMHVWTFFGFLGLWWLLVSFATGVVWRDDAVSLTLAVMLNTTLKLWITLEAGQCLAEGKKIGALELVFSTPLTEADILRGQWLALRRQFLAPVVAAIALELFLMQASVGHNARPALATYAIWLAGIFMLVADIAALVWVSMAQALAAKSLSRAMSATVLRVLILPWICFGLAVVVVEFWQELFMGQPVSPGLLRLGLWFGLGLGADVLFGLRAYQQLRGGMRELDEQRRALAVPGHGAE